MSGVLVGGAAGAEPSIVGVDHEDIRPGQHAFTGERGENILVANESTERERPAGDGDDERRGIGAAPEVIIANRNELSQPAQQRTQWHKFAEGH